MEELVKEKAVALKYNKDFAVIQANELVRSKQDELTLLEVKLIRLAIAQVVKEDTDLKTYTCNVVDLAEFLGISKDNVYRDMQKISRSLIKKSIFIKDKEHPSKKGKPNYKIFHWIDYIEYKDGTMTFKLSEGVKPYLIGLDELYTRYGYEAIRDLPTYHTIRMFELIASYQNMAVRNMPDTNYTDIPIAKNEFIFTADWLKEYFNADEKYPNTSDFIKRIVEQTVKTIRKLTLMKLSYRTIKKGRRITHIIFQLNDWNPDEAEEILAKLRNEIRVDSEYVKETINPLLD